MVKMVKLGRSIAVLISFLVISGLLSSCISADTEKDNLSSTTQTQTTSSNVTTQTDKKDSASEEKKEGTTLPLVEKQITLTYLIGEHTNSPLTGLEEGKYKHLTELMNRTNVKIEFIPIPYQNYVEKLNLTMAGGDLPDLVSTMGLANDKKYGEEGLLIRLNELIDKNAPNLKALFAKEPHLPATIASTSGDIYCIPKYTLTAGNTPTYTINNVWLYRKDILDKMQMKEPTTMEEWYEVLKAVKNNYPDMIPFVKRGSVVGWGGIQIQNAWALENYFIAMRDDKYICSPFTPEFKDMILYFKKLYEEDLIDQEYLVTDTAQWEAKIISNKGFMTADNYSRSVFFTNEGTKTNPDFLMIGAVPPINPFGKRDSSAMNPIGVNDNVAITNKCKYPEVAMSFIDYLYSTEGSTLLYFGIEGETYDLVEGKPMLKPVIKALNLVNPQRDYGYGGLYNFPGLNIDYGEPVENEALRLTLQNGAPYGYYTNILTFTDDELTKVNELTGAVAGIIESESNKFIMGVRHISEYDDFISEVKKAGGEELQKLYNQAYDRYKAVKTKQ